MPRNVGIQFSRGKYIAFLDSDDLFPKTSLEERTNLAENYQAEVIHNDEAFCFEHENSAATDTKILMDVSNYQGITRRNYSSSQVQKVTDEPANLEGRIQLWVNRGFHWATCATFIRRDFLIGNQISFPNLPNNEDMVFFFRLLCLAKTFLRVPNCTYLYRQRQDSVSRKRFADVEDHFHKWLRVLRAGFNEFERAMDEIKFFEGRFDYRYAVKDFFFNEILQQFLGFYMQNSPFLLNPLVKKEFNSDDAALSSYLFDMINIYRLRNIQLQQELSKFQQQ